MNIYTLTKMDVMLDPWCLP